RELYDALVKLSSWLTENEILHMVIGGFAVTVWGEPRFTRDLDVTVSVPPPTNSCRLFISPVRGSILFPVILSNSLPKPECYRFWLQPCRSISSLLHCRMKKRRAPERARSISSKPEVPFGLRKTVSCIRTHANVRHI